MIAENIKKIKKEIPGIKLVAVSKKKPVSDIRKAIGSGINIIGENRISEAEKKYLELKELFEKNNVEFHFIGHLQSNKAKTAVEIFDMIQTVDRLKIAKKINKYAKEIGKKQDVLIEINIGKEAQKYGIGPEKTKQFIEKIKDFENINIRGLMCIPPYKEDPIPYFKKMSTLYDEIKGVWGKNPLSKKEQKNFNILSMGMSSDYKLAVEHGSNMVRIGTKIFGAREK